MEKIIIETGDKTKLDLVKSMLEAMQIGFKVVNKEDLDNQSVLADIKEGYLEAKKMEAGEVKFKSYSSFSEMAGDL